MTAESDAEPLMLSKLTLQPQTVCRTANEHITSAWVFSVCQFSFSLLLYLFLCCHSVYSSLLLGVIGGHPAVHSGDFWGSSQKATCHESHQPKRLLYPNKKKKKPLLCNVLMLPLLLLTMIETGRKQRGRGERNEEWLKWTERGKKQRVSNTAHKLHQHDFCTSCTFIPFAIQCLPISIQQHDITDCRRKHSSAYRHIQCQWWSHAPTSQVCVSWSPCCISVCFSVGSLFHVVTPCYISS